MAHIHLPDGAFSIQWVVLWDIAALLLIGLLVWRYRKKYSFDVDKLSRTAILAALAFAIFQVEVPLFGGVHLNLTPLLGIMLGPLLGCASMLVVNILSAAMGHGGWSLLGANFLVNSIEVVLGYLLFLFFARFIKSRFTQADLSTTIALMIGNFTMVAIIGVSGIQGSSLTSLEIVQNLLPLNVLNLALAVVEGTITGFVVSYVSRIKPEILAKTTTGVVK